MVDHSGQIPPGHLDLLAAEGFYGLGSGGETRTEVARVVEELATGCLTTAFVWLQHLGAVRAAAGTDHPGVREEWLDPLRRGQRRAGLAFGGLRPGPASLVAHPVPGGYRFDGTVPWVSGWRYVDCLLAAARTPDDTIVWALVDTGPTGGASPTIDVERVPLVAVDASDTVHLRLDAHPVPDSRVTGTLPYAQWPERDAAGLRLNGSLSLGVVSRCARLLDDPVFAERLDGCRTALDAAGPAEMPDARAAAASLAVHASAALMVATGADGVRRGGTAERLAREAQFLLVFGSRPGIRAGLTRRLTACG